MASIQRIVSSLTKDVCYRAQVRVKGRPTESKSFTNRKDAKEWAAALESAIRDARYFPSRKAQRTLLAELIERYRRDVLKDPSREAHLDWWKERFLTVSVFRRQILSCSRPRNYSDASPPMPRGVFSDVTAFRAIAHRSISAS